MQLWAPCLLLLGCMKALALRSSLSNSRDVVHVLDTILDTYAPCTRQGLELGMTSVALDYLPWLLSWPNTAAASSEQATSHFCSVTLAAHPGSIRSCSGGGADSILPDRPKRAMCRTPPDASHRPAPNMLPY